MQYKVVWEGACDRPHFGLNAGDAVLNFLVPASYRVELAIEFCLVLLVCLLLGADPVELLVKRLFQLIEGVYSSREHFVDAIKMSTVKLFEILEVVYEIIHFYIFLSRPVDYSFHFVVFEVRLEFAWRPVNLNRLEFLQHVLLLFVLIRFQLFELVHECLYSIVVNGFFRCYLEGYFFYCLRVEVDHEVFEHLKHLKVGCRTNRRL